MSKKIPIHFVEAEPWEMPVALCAVRPWDPTLRWERDDGKVLARQAAAARFAPCPPKIGFRKEG